MKAVIIVPYSQMVETVQQVLADYHSAEQIEASVYQMTAEQVDGASFSGDVIIARGFTVELLQSRFPEQLIVPMNISAYDIIDAVFNVIEKYHPSKVAFVGSTETVSKLDRACRIFPIPILPYKTADVGKLRECMDQAAADGCDCFVGGLSMIRNIAEGEQYEMIQTGKATVLASLEEAVRLVRSTWEQREKSAQYKTILDYSHDGIISFRRDGRITSLNKTAGYYLGSQSDGNCIGRPAQEALPFAWKAIRNMLEKGEKIEKEIFEYNSRLLIADCIPIRQPQGVLGGILFLRSANRLQAEQSIIYKKINSRGQRAKYSFENIIHKSDALGQIIGRAKMYAKTDSPVLIMGETGTGKELFAQSIHNESSRRNRSFIAVNCAALPESLLESELFGYTEGAFTGAARGGRSGLFEAAHGGTIFLDEISELPFSFQSKLLRVLQEREVRRIGSQDTISINVRLIAASNHDLREQMEKGLFRSDLLFRINVLSLYIPPLRDRTEDIMSLFDANMQEFTALYGKTVSMVTAKARDLLEQQRWEGNARELRNIAERACVLGGSVIDENCIKMALSEGSPREQITLCAQSEQEIISQLLQRYDSNRNQVAAELGIDRSTLWRKMKKYGLQ